MSTFLFFADDWGRHPSSSQYLAKELAKDYQVIWINTVGMRRLRWDRYTISRGLEKISQWLKGGSSPVGNANINVVDPIQIPNWRSRISRCINGRMIRRNIQQRVSNTGERIIGISALPLPPEWLDLIPCADWVYYCVDNFSDWSGLDGATLREFESYLIRRARIVITVSEVLRQRVYARGRSSYLLAHGIELGIWKSDRYKNNGATWNLPKPAVVWWGLVDERLDWDWIVYAAKSLDPAQLIFVGKVQYRPPHITQYRNIHFLGNLEARQLPRLAKQADVLMMPYADTPVTRAMQPLKLLEYLASGKPIVARNLPAVERWRDFLVVAENKHEFVQGIRKMLNSQISPDEINRRWTALQEETWQAKNRQLIKWLKDAGMLS